MRRLASARLVAATTSAALVAIAIVLAVSDAPPATPLRRAYTLPVLLAAFRFGLPGASLAVAGALLFDAPLLLPAIERARDAAAEAAATYGTLALAGVATGLLASRAHRRHVRYETLLAVQRALATPEPLDTALARLHAGLGRRLGATAIALAVPDGDRLLVAGGDRVVPGSAVDRVLASGRSLFVADAGGEGRPRRVFVAPLRAGDLLGALAVERVGELDADERAAIEALGAHVGLALTNARLASRQRRFADDLAEKVAAATRRLEEADRAKSTFVAVASHELRTPLTALKGFAELLAVRAFPAAEVKRLADIMGREIDRLARIVSDLLDLSRLERGVPPALRRATVPVERALASAVSILERGFPGRCIALECEPGVPPADADPDAFDRIVTNLMSNALKYSPAGAPVRVRARAAVAGVEVSIEDRGRGIAAAALAHVFEPYYRAADTSGATRGDGIGLAVVKGLVDAHGGWIRLESAPGCGTRVTFWLPAASGFRGVQHSRVEDPGSDVSATRDV